MPVLTEPIPFVDLLAQHREVESEVRAGFDEILSTGAFVGGAAVTTFEEEFAAYCQRAHCVGVGNGTDAIELALRALHIGPGHEVIVPTNTFIATAEAAIRTGAEVVLVDCDEHHQLIDTDAAMAAVTSRTRAVAGVHLFGQLAPLEQLAALAQLDIAIVEDAAQAQGATRHGRPIGSFGQVAATSFYPGKNLGAYGDAGAVITDDESLALDVRAMSNHGGLQRYEHRLVGVNSRLDALQAVVLRAKLRRLDGWNEQRRVAAARYDELLADLPDVRRPMTAPGNVHVWHLYTVRVPNRDRVLQALQAEAIGAGIHYPTPVHLTEAFAHLGIAAGTFPVAEDAARTMVSLPMHPHLTASQQERVVDCLRGAL